MQPLMFFGWPTAAIRSSPGLLAYPTVSHTLAAGHMGHSSDQATLPDRIAGASTIAYACQISQATVCVWGGGVLFVRELTHTHIKDL